VIRFDHRDDGGAHDIRTRTRKPATVYRMSLVPSYDVIELLPPGAADRLRALRQRFHDTNKLIPKFEEIREAADARTQGEQRLRRLLDHQSTGGFHLDPTDPGACDHVRRAAMNTIVQPGRLACQDTTPHARAARKVLGDPASRPPLTQTATLGTWGTGRRARGWDIALRPCPVRAGAVQSARPSFEPRRHGAFELDLRPRADAQGEVFAGAWL
jgi:hypothetical protein